MCDCAPRPICGVCSSPENIFVNMHDSMLKMAMKDAYNQQDLAQKAKLQVDLFQKAQQYAKDVGIQEMKAKQFANILNEATRKAQYARAMMFNVFFLLFVNKKMKISYLVSLQIKLEFWRIRL